MAGYPLSAAAPASPEQGASERRRAFFVPTSTRTRQLVGVCAAGPDGAGQVVVQVSRRAVMAAVTVTLQQANGHGMSCRFTVVQAAKMAQGLRLVPLLALTAQQATELADMLDRAAATVASTRQAQATTERGA